jgi:glutathione synthase/RimK-type ligase-like ATP-grasp enzyme
MEKSMVLIISDRKDIQAYVVMLELDAIGVRSGIFNVADFPTNVQASQLVGGDADHCQIELDGGSVIKTSDVSAVWYRKPDLPRLHLKVSSHEREFAFNEIQAGLLGIYDAMNHAYWISRIESIRNASNKLGQLRRAARLGLIIPKSIFTNDARMARDFIASVAGAVVYKPIGGRVLGTRAGPWEDPIVIAEMYTTLLDNATVDIGLERLAVCPSLFQEYIEKEVDLRVTIVGNQIFAVEIHSQAEGDGMVDWRRAKEPSLLEHRIHTLPPSIGDRCLKLVRSFGLEFGAIDMALGKDGEYVFLEINPNGQFGWIEEKTGLRISKAIAAQLSMSGCN